MPRPPRPDDLYRLRIATEPRPLAGRPLGRRDAADRRLRLRWVPARPLARPDRRRRRRAPPAHARRPARPAAPLLPGRSDARVHLGSADRRRGGAQGLEGRRGSRGRVPGPPPPARRPGRRGAPADRPATWRQNLRVVAGRHAARRRVGLGRGDHARTTRAAAARTSGASPANRHRPTIDSSTGSSTCSTARASSTTA